MVTEHQQTIAQATADLEIAERELESALGKLTEGPRADKKMISVSLQAAFDKVTTARKILQKILGTSR